MELDLTYLEKCTLTLSKAYELLQSATDESIECDMYRSACIKEFEIILEQSGKLLKKVLKPYFANPKSVDSLIFKDIFRHAALHNIIDLEACERWLNYRDNRNSTAHDYGVGFAEDTLLLLPQFITDASNLIAAIKKENE